jgi:signal transduction histidine kinase
MLRAYTWITQYLGLRLLTFAVLICVVSLAALDFVPVFVEAAAMLVAAIGFAGSILRERTAVKAANLAASEGQTMRFFALMRDLVLIVDASGQVTTSNPRSRDLLGVDARQIIGRVLLDFVGSNDVARVAAILRDVRKGTPTAEFEAAVRSVNQVEIPVFWSVTYSAEDRTLMIVARDLRSRLAREQRASRHRKLEALAAFTGGFAHEFGSLITVILGESESLREDRSAEPRQRERGQRILESAGRAAELTQSLIAFARKTQSVAGMMDVDRALRRACDVLKPTLSGAALELELNAHNAMVRFDQERLIAVMGDIFANARDAIRDGNGRIRVATKFVKAGAAVEISISDNGAGMDSDTLERAVDPFFTTKEPGSGTGLGLSHVHGVVSSMGGAVALQSQPGVGTTVSVTLPLLDDEGEVLPDPLTVLASSTRTTRAASAA